MSESAAGQVFEAAVDIVNPGGDPEALREAAHAWRALGVRVAEIVANADADVNAVVGSAWSGEAAEAFAAHWGELGAGLGGLGPHCEAVAANLEAAAEAIEEINSAIHAIALELGITVGLSVGMSFFTFGFSAAAGAARAAMLGARALQLVKTLGMLLARVAEALRALSLLSKSRLGVFLADHHRLVAVNVAGNVGGNVGADLIYEPNENNVGEAVWKGAVSGVVGTGVASASSRGSVRAGEALEKVGKFGRISGGLQSSLGAETVGAAAGNVAGGLAADGINMSIKNSNEDSQDNVTKADVGWNAAMNGIAGGVTGAGSHVLHKHVAAEGSEVMSGIGPRLDRNAPHFSIDAVPAATGNGIIQGSGEHIYRALNPRDDDLASPG
jgi:uncharacterized protein YukE